MNLTIKVFNKNTNYLPKEAALELRPVLPAAGKDGPKMRQDLLRADPLPGVSTHVMRPQHHKQPAQRKIRFDQGTVLF